MYVVAPGNECMYRTRLFRQSVWSMDPTLSMGADAASGVVHRLQPAVGAVAGAGVAVRMGAAATVPGFQGNLCLCYQLARTSSLLTLLSCVVLVGLQQ